MGNEKMPDERLKSFGVRSDMRGINRRDDHACIGFLCSESSVASHNTHDACALFLRDLHGVDEIHGDVLFFAAAADGENEDAILRIDLASPQPIRNGSVPTFVVDARGQFGNVVGWAVRFEAAELSEIADSVRGVSRAAAGSDEKQSSVLVPRFPEDANNGFNCLRIEEIDYLLGLGKKIFSECHVG